MFKLLMRENTPQKNNQSWTERESAAGGGGCGGWGQRWWGLTWMERGLQMGGPLIHGG